MFRGDLNVEQAREVVHAAPVILFVIIDQLQMLHTILSQNVNIS